MQANAKFAEDSTLADLDLDAWAAISPHLSLPDLANVQRTSRQLRDQLVTNDALWHSRYARAWPTWPTSGRHVGEWRHEYVRAHHAAQQLLTRGPESWNWPRPYGSHAPQAAQLLVHRADGPAGQSSLRAAGSIDQRLWWWASGGEDRRQLSSSQHGHTAFVDALVEVAAAEGAAAGQLPGYASGSRDTTIKLWAPFAGGSGSADGVVRPLRTLRGHNAAVAALALVPASGGGGAGVLASGSADKTVRLWSLQPLLGRGGGAASAACGAQEQGRSPLLATLRGHGSNVTGVTVLDTLPGSVISAGLDSRVKVWDMVSGACSATLRLSRACHQLLPCFAPSGCVAAVLASGFELVDPRAAEPALALAAPPRWGPLLCAAAQLLPSASGGGGGSDAWYLAAGQHWHAHVWDLRMLATQRSAASGAVQRAHWPLLSVRQAKGCEVTSVQLDRNKLLTSTRGVQLHASYSMAAWSLPDGRLLTRLSCTQSPVSLRLNAGPYEALFQGGDGAAWDLIAQMPDEGAGPAGWQGQGVPAGAAPAPTPGAAAAAAGGGGGSASGGSASGSDGGWDDEGDAPSDGSGGERTGGEGSEAWGRLEPGVLALALSGSVVATCDTLGTLLVRDFGGAGPPLLVADGRLTALPAQDAEPAASKFWDVPATHASGRCRTA